MHPPPVLCAMDRHLSCPDHCLYPLNAGNADDYLIHPRNSRASKHLLSYRFPPLPTLYDEPVRYVSRSQSLVFVCDVNYMLKYFHCQGKYKTSFTD